MNKFSFPPKRKKYAYNLNNDILDLSSKEKIEKINLFSLKNKEKSEQILVDRYIIGNKTLIKDNNSKGKVKKSSIEIKRKDEYYPYNEFNKIKDFSNNPIFDHKVSMFLKKEEIEEIEKELVSEIKGELKEEEKIKKIINKALKSYCVPYKHKKYNEKEINELDFDEAIIYDKRNICKIFIYVLKQKQSIINTFFVKNPIKPFSIKLLLIIFSFSCYFVINGFLYNQEYISNKIYNENEENRNFVDYLYDSIERIIYASIIGGFISFMTDIAFDFENKVENAINKHKDNTILMKGEISKIYKCNNIKIIMFYYFAIYHNGFIYYLYFLFLLCLSK